MNHSLFLILRTFLLFCFLTQYIGFLHSQQNLQFVNLGIEDGLVGLEVSSVFQDKEGYMWIGTYTGLNRYDGNDFLTIEYIPNDSTSLAGNIVMDMTEQNGRLLIATMFNGVNVLNKKSLKVEKVIRIRDPLTENKTCNLTTIYKDRKGNIWAGTEEHGLFLLDTLNSIFRQSYPFVPDTTFHPSRVIRFIYEDLNDMLWLGTEAGLVRFDPKMKEYHIFYPEKTTNRFLLRQHIQSIFEYEKGTLWLGTGAGLCYLDPVSQKIKVMKNFPELQNEVILDIKKTKNGMIWLAGSKKIFAYNPVRETLSMHTHIPYRSASIAKRSYLKFLEDKAGSLWIIGKGGVSILHPSELLKARHTRFAVPERLAQLGVVRNLFNTGNALWMRLENYPQIVTYDFKTGKTNAISPSFLASAFCKDSKGNIWAGSRMADGVAQYNEQGKLLFFLPTPAGENMHINHASRHRLKGGPVFGIQEDYKENIWIGMDGGLNCYRPEEDTLLFFPYSLKDSNSISGTDILSLYIDSQDRLWVGTYNSGINMLYLDQYYTSGKAVFQKYQFEKKNNASLSNNSAFGIIEDADGDIWIYTAYGINKFLSESNTFKQYTTQLSIPNKRIMSGIVSKAGALWFSTEDYGLLYYDKIKDKFVNYTKDDGLEQRSFLMASAALGLDSTLIFCGKNRALVIDEIQLRQQGNDYVPPTYITGIQVGEKTFNPRLQMQPMQLTYRENEIRFRFAALNYIVPNKNRYQCMLEGYDDRWRDLNHKTEITFNNLSPGEYRFLVKGANNKGLWNDKAAEFSFVIHPPWWKTTWAWALYLIFAVSIIYTLYRFQLNRQLDKQEAKRLQELDEFKSQLYTNITHEFRTPLTVILGMADRATQFFKGQGQEQEQFRQSIQMVKRNGKQLLRLVNQMLDLASLDAGRLEINWQQDDVVNYIKYLTESFHSMATAKNIDIGQQHEQPGLIMDFDADKLQKIVSNLLSNAIKYTGKNGHVGLRTGQENGHFTIEVKDNGQGIPEAELPHIFDRFYQAKAADQQGTGVGLALTRELVKLLGGTITVESQVGVGSTFTVQLPIHRKAELGNAKKEMSVSEASHVPVVATQNIPTGKKEAPIILIIEDNPEVAFYLGGCLEKDYQLLYAKDGQEGIDKAIEHIPDFIISDVMMPKKDGFVVCQTLKTDERTSHIPIILLTAKADAGSRLSGLQQGADAYLTKPFNEQELQVRIQQMITLRQRLQAKYRHLEGNGEPQSSEREVLNTPTEDAFLQKIRQVVEEHLLNPDLDVSFLCQKIAMSRTQLHRKLTALTNHSTTQFIRSVRYQKAKVLLKDTDLTISEITYDVGFGDPAYFARMFKKEVGVTPTEFREGK